MREEFSSVNPCCRIKTTLKYYLCNSRQLRSSLLILLRNRRRRPRRNYIISRKHSRKSPYWPFMQYASPRYAKEFDTALKALTHVHTCIDFMKSASESICLHISVFRVMPTLKYVFQNVESSFSSNIIVNTNKRYVFPIRRY